MIAALIGLPRWAQMLGGAALLALAALAWLHFHDRAVVKEHEARVSQATASQSAAAGDAAAGAIDQSRTEVEKANAQARDAAARDAADPLRAGLDRLRDARAKDRPATR